ncbi:ribbon-helix-helix domain-containing protein [Rhizobium sp. CB3171]|uniref:ribbon-helix-helix domain-containing protein n=1 Tax=Rhizobium sp. CB3171 TaxID=3039157 RepID=UPI0032C22667
MMCRVLKAQSPQRFLKVSRSVRISGHSTSVRLEAAFWQVLEDIAKMEGLSTSKLISVLYNEALELHGDMSNLASMLRTVCLIYREERRTEIAVPHIT